MYKYLFGPVPSRRLGMSLGVDLVPHKVCSLDCVYCECGPTTKLTLQRMEYIPYVKVTAELDHYFSNDPDPDYITFSGSGEPTLNSRVGDVLRYIKKEKPAIPVAVLTNGTLLGDAAVRKEILDADVVLPSLDAATQDVFLRINRPAVGLNIRDYVGGLEAFRDMFTGQIWLEVFIIPGCNDNRTELAALRKAIRRIRPDKIQLNTLDRPGTVGDLEAASRSRLQQVIDYWQLEHAEIISDPVQRKNIQSYRKDTETAILETIARRPCTPEDLAGILGLHVNEVNKYLDVLEAESKITPVRQQRGIFYRSV